MDALLSFYVPALFIIGHNVRTLYWEGGVSGTVKGTLARTVLQQCLGVHVHLQQDWDCKAEYSRTLSVALLSWQPYHSGLPGCCFVEEACEALLSRMVARRRSNQHVVSMEDMLRLYVTLPVPKKIAPGTRGALRRPLVEVMLGRLRNLLRAPGDQPYARVTSAKEAHWEPTLPGTCGMPDVLTQQAARTSLATVLQSALVTLAAGTTATGSLQAAAAATFAQVGQQEQDSRRVAMQRVQQWAAERHQRAARSRQDANASQGSQRQRRRTQAPRADVSTSSAAATGAQPGPTEPVIVDTAPSQPDSQEDSLYEPPSDGEYSAGYHSFGDTDSLGSAGDLVEGRQADWDTPEDVVPWDDL